MDKSFLDMFARFSTKNENLKLSKETLNAFEKKNLVVITGVDLERVADQLVMKMEYQTYYL
jgi:hypothetical protein